MKNIKRGIAVFFAVVLMLSCMPLQAAADPANYDYIVVGSSGTYTVYRAASGNGTYSLWHTYTGDAAGVDMSAAITAEVGNGSTTISFGAVGTGTSDLAGTLDLLYQDLDLGTSGTYTLKGHVTSADSGYGIYMTGASVIIDGATISYTGGNVAVKNDGTGNVSITGGSISSNGMAIYNKLSGTVDISGGTLSSTGEAEAVYNSGTGTVNISGNCSITSISGCAVYNKGTGAINISGGTLSSRDNNTVYNKGTGKITVSGTANITTSSVFATVWLGAGTGGAAVFEMTDGTISNTNTSTFTLSPTGVPTAIGNGGVGNVVISGGTIQSTGFGIGNGSTGNIVISGGTISVGTNGYGVSNGNIGGIYLSGSPSIIGGIANLIEVASGTIHANNGSFNQIDYSGNTLSVYYVELGTNNIVPGTTVAVAGVTDTNYMKFTSANTDPYYTLKRTGTNLYFVSHAAINTDTNTYYDDIQVALDEATTGQTVKLVSDISTTSQITYNGIDKSVTLDLNGHALSRSVSITDSGTASEAAVYAESGTLTIKDTSADADGYIKAVSSGGAGGTGLHVDTGATVNLLSGGILGCGQAITATGGAHINISGGVVYGYANAVNSEAINIPDGTYLTISGGYIGTSNSGAAMILTSATPAAGYWSFSGGYFTSQNCTYGGGTHSLAVFATNNTVTELSTAATNAISESQTYYYILNRPRTITFDASTNGGSCTTASSVTASSGELAALPAASKSGKVFDGWYTAQTGGTKITTDYVFTTDSTVFAQYVDGFTFNYYSSDGSELLSSDTVLLAGNKLVGSYVPTKPGYSFNGWATTSGSSTVAYIPGDDYTSVYNAATPKPDSLSLYTIWDDISDLNGSTNTILSSTLSYSDSNPDPKIGNSFTIAGSGTIEEPHESAYFILTGYDVDYTETDSVFLVDETSTTSYYLGYLTREPVGTTQNTTSVYTVPQYMLRSGHTFHLLLNASNSAGGFGSEIKNAYMLVDGGISSLTDKALSLSYSSGTLSPTFSVTDSSQGTYTFEYALFGFDANSVPTQLASATGTATTTAAVKTVTDTKSLSTTLATGSKYQMIVTIKNAGGVPISILTRTFYLYTYSYGLNGATGAAPAGGYVISDERLTAPTDPTYSGKTFSGWYTDESCTNKWDFSSDTASDNLEFHAKWSDSSYYGNVVTSTRTISISTVSSTVFTNTDKILFSVEANMQNAFSNSVEVRLTDNSAPDTGFTALTNNGATVYPFDISLYIKNTDTKTEPSEGYTVTVTLPLPQALADSRDNLALFHDSNGTISNIPFTLIQKGTVWCVQFKATQFSPYALVVNSGSKLPYYLDASGAKVFVGFASDASGKMKYIEKTGKTIAFISNPKSFNDISGHWAKENIAFVTERELFLGTSNNVFSPDSGMTRAMFATVLGRLYERSYGAIASVSSGDFTDVSYTDWYGKYVSWAAQNSVITGVGEGKFDPDRMITRQEMAAMLYRFADYLKAVPASDSNTALTYPDASGISSWAADAAAYCQKTGIITGRDGGAFVPQGTATRAEVAVILQRFIGDVLGN